MGVIDSKYVPIDVINGLFNFRNSSLQPLVEDLEDEFTGRGRLAVMIKRSGFRSCRDGRGNVLMTFESTRGVDVPTGLHKCEEE